MRSSLAHYSLENNSIIRDAKLRQTSWRLRHLNAIHSFCEVLLDLIVETFLLTLVGGTLFVHDKSSSHLFKWLARSSIIAWIAMRRAATSPDAQDVLTSVVVLPFIIRVDIDKFHIDFVVLSDLTSSLIDFTPSIEELTLCRSTLIDLLIHLTNGHTSPIADHTELPLCPFMSPENKPFLKGSFHIVDHFCFSELYSLLPLVVCILVAIVEYFLRWMDDLEGEHRAASCLLRWTDLRSQMRNRHIRRHKSSLLRNFAFGHCFSRNYFVNWTWLRTHFKKGTDSGACRSDTQRGVDNTLSGCTLAS